MQKLIRNLKKGDRVPIRDGTGVVERTAVVTVSAVQETRRGHFSGKRMWMVLGDYPWWWTNPITGYSNTKIKVLPKEIQT